MIVLTLKVSSFLNWYFLVFFFYYTCICLSFAQNQNNIWFFGNKAGLDFNSEPPIPISGELVSLEGTASISDPSGDLLFYTNGIRIWDRNHNLMPNGDGIIGGESSSQAALIVAKPGSCNLFYVFAVEDHMSTNSRFAYSIVDMCRNNGFGDVIPESKNTIITMPVGEKITAVRHSNGEDIWIITHHLISNEFLAYLLTPDGLDMEPVVSAVGTNYNSNANIGPLKASHNGRHLVLSATFYDICEMADFNASTGSVSNAIDLRSKYNLEFGIYGMEFSPNDSLLYLSSLWGNDFLYQIDIYNDELTTIASDFGNYNFGGLQIGSDDRIYMARRGKPYLDVITDPNRKGPSCNYIEGGQPLEAGTFSDLGLPNFVPFSIYRPVLHEISLGPDTVLCPGDVLTYDFSDLTVCNEIIFNWSDGSANSFFQITEAGEYWFEINTECQVIRDTIRVNVPVGIEQLLGNDTIICPGEDVILNVSVSGEDNVLWSTGETGNSIQVEEEGEYWVEIKRDCEIVYDTILVYLDPIAGVRIVGDTIICEGDTASLYINFEGYSGQWSTGSIADSIVVHTAGLYLATITDNLCSLVDSARIEERYPPTISLGKDTTICEGDQLVLDASYPGSTFLWQDGSGAPVFEVHQAGNYTVDVENICGRSTDSIRVEVEDCSCNFYIPNIFSPNQDGINDRFEIFTNCIFLSFKLEIFNRWGGLLFASETINDTWDGYYKGKRVGQGVYVYLIHFVTERNSEKIISGDLNVVY